MTSSVKSWQLCEQRPYASELADQQHPNRSIHARKIHIQTHIQIHIQMLKPSCGVLLTRPGSSHGLFQLPFGAAPQLLCAVRRLWAPIAIHALYAVSTSAGQKFSHKTIKSQKLNSVKLLRSSEHAAKRQHGRH